jgi:outer membrane receptor for ferrienterochelin and colicin
MLYDSLAGVSSSYEAKIPIATNSFLDGATSFYAKNQEDIKNFKIDLSRTFKLFKFLTNQVKLGAYYQYRDREFAARLLGFTQYNYNGYSFDQSLTRLTQGDIFSISNMGKLSRPRGGFILTEGTKTSDSYAASSEQLAYYAMLDQRFGKVLRLIYGVRFEEFTQVLVASEGPTQPVNLNYKVIDKLPSANAIFSITPKQNFRLSYSKTLNRPEFRELAPFGFYDFAIRYFIGGKPSLRRAVITNYDARYEFYPGKGQIISVSAFYKDFKDPIELVSSDLYDSEALYANLDSATSNYGAELEMRMLLSSVFGSWNNKVFDRLTAYANVSLIQSKVKNSDSTFRQLQGQSRYLYNTSLTYQNDDKNFSLSANLNRVGDRIFLVGSIINPDIWEKARTVVDLQFSMRFKQKTEMKINVKDILAQNILFYNDYNSNGNYERGTDFIISSFKAPRTVSINFTYNF